MCLIKSSLLCVIIKTLTDKERKNCSVSSSGFCLIKKVNIVVCPYHETVCYEIEHLYRAKQHRSGKSEADSLVALDFFVIRSLSICKHS